MQRSGFVLLDFFSGLLIFLPLLPAAIILLRKFYSKHVMIYLLLLCLLYFTRGLFYSFANQARVNISPLETIFGLFELLLILQLFKPVFSHEVQQWMNLPAIAFFSVTCSFVLLKPASQNLQFFNAIQAALISLISSLAIMQIVKKRKLLVLRHPEFWIGIGILFYYSIFFLITTIPEVHSAALTKPENDRVVIIDVLELLRYFFFTIAVLCGWPQPKNDFETAA